MTDPILFTKGQLHKASATELFVANDNSNHTRQNCKRAGGILSLKMLNGVFFNILNTEDDDILNTD